MKARFAKPKTREEAAALHDVDDAEEIQKQVEKSKPALRRPDSDGQNGQSADNRPITPRAAS
jgi:hypothetical protein